MEIAVIADVHANFIALQRVAEDLQNWDPDEVIVAGDLVNRGPRPAECLHFVQEKQRSQGWRVLRGNHEDYVISQAREAAPRQGPHFEVHRASFWTYQQLGEDVSALEAMPFQLSLVDPSGGEVRLVHASMRGIRDGIYPENSDQEICLKMGIDCLEDPCAVLDPPAPAVFCVGHTHRPLIRQVHDTLVVNAGSTGLPFDRDIRPAYARLTWQKGGWKAEIVRLDYDLERAERDFLEAGYLSGGGPLVELVQVELHEARSMLYNWAVRYQQLAWNGEISMEESVHRFLQEFS